MLLSSGLQPVMSDQLGSAFETFNEKNSIEACLVNLAGCDIVVFILSQRYGPSLASSGFGDFSATHLEYNEAKKLGKKIVFFVRDFLMADYNIYSKNSENLNNLSWVKNSKDARLFEIIADRKKLTSSPTDNWYWSFRNSLDVKERLLIELKPSLKAIAFDKAIDEGKVPHMAVNLSIDNITPKHIISNAADLAGFNFVVRNLGKETAIQPLFVIYRASSYEQVLEEKMASSVGAYKLQEMTSLLPGEQTSVNMQVLLTERKGDTYEFVVEIWYKTVNGYLLADASEVSINVLLFPKLNIKVNHTTKRHVHANALKRMVDSSTVVDK